MSVKEMMMRNATSGKYARAKFVPLVGASPEEYLTWISYSPDHLNISNLMAKSAKDLSEEELNALEFMIKERKVRSSFENFIYDEKTTSKAAKDVYNYMKGVSIDQVAYVKLLPEEINYCVDETNKLLSEKGLDEAIAVVTSKGSDDIKNLYILYRLRSLYNTRANVRASHEINCALGERWAYTRTYEALESIDKKTTIG